MRIINKFKTLFEVLIEIISSRKLIFSLSKNDFRTRFAGSYLGIIWAFVQPVVTVLVYWFVFTKALNAGTRATKAGIDVPFVLWLIAGIIPWFFFQEALSSGTNALLEYNYLVKKVVFKISILPIVKVTSALYVHLFFVAFALILYAAYNMLPGVILIQLLYYSFALTMFCIALVYTTSALVVFFRDLSQIINILLQVGIWFTPIMWNVDSGEINMSPTMLQIIKANPVFYIVQGYRDTLLNQTWFWVHWKMTIYFWCVTAFLFLLGLYIFRKTRVHFADVL